MDRFWDKVAIGGPDECWEWTASTFKDGYGRFGMPVDGVWRSRRAHRVAYELAYAEDPSWGSLTNQVLHSCDNPACCNPNHLRYGTHLDNMADMAERKRARNGKETWTHCRHHPEQELSIMPDGYRACRLCRREHTTAWYRRHATEVIARRRTVRQQRRAAS